MSCPWPSPLQAKLEELAACLCAQIAADGLPDVCFCGVIPGAQVALDYAGNCDTSCGMAWVRLAAFYPSATLGQPSQEPGNCSVALGLDVELGIARCAATLDADGEPPPASVLLAEAELQWADALAMRRAVLCCLYPGDVIIAAYTPFGPEGGMVGGTLGISLQV